MAGFRVEREWVPLKQYLPTQSYAEVLDLLQNDPVYLRLDQAGNETKMNAMIRCIVHEWLKHRKVIEDANGTTQYRQSIIETEKAIHEEIQRREQKKQ